MAEPSPDGAMRVLLVEDEQTIAVTLQDDLEGAGHEVKHIADGKEAVGELERKSYDVVITEIMANADVESTGEFIEVYNNSSSDIDLLYWVVYDGDAVDTILGFSDPYDTVLPAGGYAIILDSDYNGDYASTLASSALVLTTDDGAIGSGLSTSDEIYLYDADVALVDSFTSPSNPGNAISIERVEQLGRRLFTGHVAPGGRDGVVAEFAMQAGEVERRG